MVKYCINLDRRTDKYEYAKAEFDRVGLDVKFFSAYDKKPGWKGCRDSHLAVLEMCKNVDAFMVFEDDPKFLWGTDMITLASMELPHEEWDMLSLGCSPQEPLERYSEHLFRLNKTAWCLHAYIITNKNGLIDFVLENRAQIGKIDKWFSENVYTNIRFNCFVAYPLICTQVQFQSDTCKRSDVSTIEKQYAKFVR